MIINPPSEPFNVPVVLFAFNRPDYTLRTLTAIKDIYPDRLYVVLDGPRPSHPRDLDLCGEVYQIIQTYKSSRHILINSSPVNLGLRERITSGLNWVFSLETQAIILEDDCIPSASFFYFCSEMLFKYSDNYSVSSISGSCFQRLTRMPAQSYYFSKYSHCWGWATWRRAWVDFDPSIPFWPSYRSTANFKKLHPLTRERNYWRRVFDSVYSKNPNSWAYPWTLFNWYMNRFSIIPYTNLVSNVGFDSAATHTVGDHYSAYQPAGSMQEITHPLTISQNVAADRHDFEYHFSGRDLRFHRRLFLRLTNLTNSLF